MITVFMWGFLVGMAFEYFYQMRQADKHIRFEPIEPPNETEVSNNGATAIELAEERKERYRRLHRP